MKKSQLRQLIREALDEMSYNEDQSTWPFLDNSENVIRRVIDKFIAGDAGSFVFLATRAGQNEKKLNAILDIMKEKLKAKAKEIDDRNAAEWQARYGPGGGQETAAGTYTGG